MPDEIKRPEICEEVRRSTAEHEVFLAFNGDVEAYLFSVWIQGAGWDAFVEWAGLNKEFYT